MPTYSIRPYYGHDCDSESGFNDGHYLDEIEVEADDEYQAMDKAMKLFQNTQMEIGSGWVDDSWMGDTNLYFEYNTRWIDEKGNEYYDESEIPLDPDTNQTIDTEPFYRYRYIDFSEVTQCLTKQCK